MGKVISGKHHKNIENRIKYLEIRIDKLEEFFGERAKKEPLKVKTTKKVSKDV